MTTPPSLRQQLLRWLAPATALLLVASAGAGYFVAVGSATLAYDRALLDGALALSQQLQLEDGRLVLRLLPQAREVLTTDRYDRIFFAVRGPRGELIGGSSTLTLPPGEFEHGERSERSEPADRPDRGESGRYPDAWRYADHQLDGVPVRVAALRTVRAGEPVTVLMAETTVKRSRLVREVLLGILVPELALVLATLALVFVGVRRGLRPLEGLRGQLARRSHADLRPLAVNALPEELQPLAAEINGLLARLDASLQAQQHFVADAAHQLRTPIAALQAQVEALRQESERDQAQRLAPVLAGMRRLAHLVHQLLALARAEPHNGPPASVLELDALIRDCADRWLPAAIARGIDLGFELAPARVAGEALLLAELLTNLVDNAIRYTPAGGAVTVRCLSAGGRVRLEVDDSGRGIAPGERERVFERFVRLDGSDSEGCGLGLAIVRTIAAQHGAVASIGESPLGGARVSVEFPAAA